MNVFYLSIGSNVEPEKNIPASIASLKKQFPGARFSTVYETEPVGPAGEAKFWNLAAEIRTNLNREGLYRKLREIEETLGRKRGGDKFAPRTIDIDLLPQPGYRSQAFIIVPLAEIAPDETDAETGEKFSTLAEPLKKESATFRKIF